MAVPRRDPPVSWPGLVRPPTTSQRTDRRPERRSAAAPLSSRGAKRRGDLGPPRHRQHAPALRIFTTEEQRAQSLGDLNHSAHVAWGVSVTTAPRPAPIVIARPASIVIARPAPLSSRGAQRRGDLGPLRHHIVCLTHAVCARRARKLNHR
jgi:hypothetical protein